MRSHFRLEGAWELNQLVDGHGELGLSHFGCEVTSDRKARWNLDQLGDGHGELGTVLFQMRGHFRLEGALELNQLNELGLSHFGCEVTSDWKARWS